MKRGTLRGGGFCLAVSAGCAGERNGSIPRLSKYEGGSGGEKKARRSVINAEGENMCPSEQRKEREALGNKAVRGNYQTLPKHLHTKETVQIEGENPLDEGD